MRARVRWSTGAAAVLLALAAAAPGAAAAGGPVAAEGSGAGASPSSAGASPAAGHPAAGLLTALPAEYLQAVRAHDVTIAARLRGETRLLAGLSGPTATRRPLTRLAAALAATRDTLQPWPTAAAITRLTDDARRAVGPPPSAPASPYDHVRDALDDTRAAVAANQRERAVLAALDAYALSRPLVSRLGLSGASLEGPFWSTSPDRPGLLVALQRRASAHAIDDAAGRVDDAVDAAQQSLGDVQISRATVVTDAAILVFREGLEAVLILAAITASFVGARRHLRRPVLLGGLAGIVATAVTWLIAQLVIHELGTGGLRLEAITGILAIAVLLVITNWFFHRVYWSQWIARFNRRRKSLERLDRLGFISGQVAALAILGLTSVYREGFETVLFLQNLQVSAGTTACLLGAGLGLAATLAVGGLTFVAQRKLPYKKMLIATGMLIALVLAVMTGTTVHVVQGLGWLPTTPTGFTVPLWANSWLGLYATWEGLAAQAGALVIVLGSYAVAREVQVRRPQRRGQAQAEAAVVPH